MEIVRPPSKQPIPPSAKLVFKGVIFDVYQWEQELYDGTTATFEKLKRVDTTSVIAITDDRKIMLQIQEQPGKKEFTCLPGGRAEEGEDPLTAAKRELLEETGYAGEDWSLFEANQPITKIDWAIYTFIARGCKKVAETDLDGGEKITTKFVTFDEFAELVMNDVFLDIELKVRFLEAKLDPQKMTELRKLLS